MSYRNIKVNNNIKHLHIMTKSNYAVVSNYIRFISIEFDNTEHAFIICDAQNSNNKYLSDIANVIWIPNPDNRDRKKMFSYLKKANRIYWHFMHRATSTQLLLLLHPKILKKSFWIAWGADLYNWRRESKGYKIFIRNNIMYQLRKKIKYFVGIFPPDIDFFNKKFGSNAKTFYASYVGAVYNPLYQKELELYTLKEKIAHNECINIQIGHSSTKSLNHKEVLETLSKYKNENIKIYIPLSYGDEEYGNHIEREAKRLFENKVVCIREMMDKESYMDFLSSIDIAIYNTWRQIGIGNIIPTLYMQKKIFMPNCSQMYDFYKSQGISICDYREIEKMDFLSFINPVDMRKAKEYTLSDYIDIDQKKEMWSNVFDAIIK